MKKIVILLSLLVFVASCVDNNPNQATDSGFERQPYLASYAEDVIIPSYETYVAALENLVAQLDDPSSSMEDIRHSFKESYLQWQGVALYAFGPALDNNILAQSNSYPTDTTKIVDNISSTAYKLSSVSNYGAKGFPALDFILFTRESLTPDERLYSATLASDLLQLAMQVHSAWVSDFTETFIERDGNDVGSSLGLMLNAFNQYLERDFRNGKLAIPLGWKTGGTPHPNHAEAYYSGYSQQLLVAGCQAISRFYLGGNKQQENKGIYGMITAVGDRYQNGDLPTNIYNDLKNLHSRSENLSAPISDLASQNDPHLNDTYTAAKKLVVQFKSNIPSALGVMITYQDNDGD